MTRPGRRSPSGRRMVIGAVAICATLGLGAAGPAPAAAPTPANLFTVKVKSEGAFVADFGDDRNASDSRGFGTDGRELISWQWELQAVARPKPHKGIDLKSTALRFRSVTSEYSDLVEYDHLGGPSGGELREFPACPKPTYENKRRTVDAQDDSAPSGQELSRGAWVGGPLLELFDDGGLRIRGMGDATAPHECFAHEDMHGLRFASVTLGDAELPPRAFDPTDDDELDKTFPDGFSLPVDHSGIAPAYHTAEGSSSLTLVVRRVSRNTWERRRDEYRDSGQYDLHNCTPNPSDPNC